MNVIEDYSSRLTIEKAIFISSVQCTAPIQNCQKDAVVKMGEFLHLNNDLSEERSGGRVFRCEQTHLDPNRGNPQESSATVDDPEHYDTEHPKEL